MLLLVVNDPVNGQVHCQVTGGQMLAQPSMGGRLTDDVVDAD